MAKYTVLEPTFIAPNLYKGGEIVEYDGPPGPHLDPMDDEARRATDAYIKANPNATTRPVEQLPMTTSTLIKPAEPQVLSMHDALTATLAKAQPGLADGGVAIAVGTAPSRVSIDPPGVGSNAPTADQPPPVKVSGLTPKADDVSLNGPKPTTAEDSKPTETPLDLEI